MNVWLKFQVTDAEERALRLKALAEAKNGDKGWWRKWLRKAILKAIEPPKTKLTMAYLEKMAKNLKDAELK